MKKFGCPYIIKKIQAGYNAPQTLCDELDACYGGSNFIAKPGDDDKDADKSKDADNKKKEGTPDVYLVVGLSTAGAVIAAVAAAIAVVVVLRRRANRRSPEVYNQLGDEPAV